MNVKSTTGKRLFWRLWTCSSYPDGLLFYFACKKYIYMCISYIQFSCKCHEHCTLLTRPHRITRLDALTRSLSVVPHGSQLDFSFILYHPKPAIQSSLETVMPSPCTFDVLLITSRSFVIHVLHQSISSFLPWALSAIFISSTFLLHRNTD